MDYVLNKTALRALSVELMGLVGCDREFDIALGRALGWRVSRDEYWNWNPGPVYDPPGDEWCIRKDGRSDVPCNEALPRFSDEAVFMRGTVQAIINDAIRSDPATQNAKD